MKYKLINPINPKYTAIQQVLVNRGISYDDINHYLHLTNQDINKPEVFGEEKLKSAVTQLINCIQNEKKAIVVIDADCDGYTSAAILINYLYDLFPNWVLNNLSWIIHTGKQHGLNDCIDKILTQDISVVILPDAGTNDTIECEQLHNKGILSIILDHHDKEIDNPYAIIINNQIDDYPNKELSGAGVTWQFCRYIDKLLNTSYANNYIDLAALGNLADMMSLRNFETKQIIQEGLKDDNVKNPFIAYLAERNSFSLKGKLTPIGVAFYIAPFVNAIVRSGNQDEKELVFKSMLKFTAFEEVPSTKRGHAPGEIEKIVEQAIRTATNVKARQTKAQDNGMAKLEQMIKDKNLLDHKVLLFLIEPGQIDKNIAGLCANKIMAKYQRPVCILTRVEKEEITYEGSARGCDKVDIRDFKGICAATGVVEYTVGHPGAFGLGIKENNINAFIEKTDELLKDMPDEAIYYVDYIYDVHSLSPEQILDIASLEYYWGKDVDQALVAIRHIKVTPDMVTIYDKKTTTIKIQLPNNISLMLFNAKDEDCEKLQTKNTGYIEVEIVGTCECNTWMDQMTPQIFISEYQVVDSNKFFF